MVSKGPPSMATAPMRVRVMQPIPFVERRAGAANSRAAFRLLSAERSDEIFPILMEEIVSLGFPRALVANLDLETGEIRPVAAINCSKTFQQRFTTALWQADNPLSGVIQGMKPALLPK